MKKNSKKSIALVFVALVCSAAFALDPSKDEYGAKPVKVTASNTLIEDANNPDKYGAQNLIDNTYKSWAGKGVGTEFVFDFKSEVKIYGITIRNGYGSLGYYLKNNRVKSIKISSEKQELGSCNLPDTPDPHCISWLDSPITAKQIKITITGIYKGSEFDDTCISEITFLDSPEYCYDYYKEKEFKYDSWRGNLFAEIYKADSKKARKDASGRCQAYTAIDFESDTKWTTIPEHLHNAIYPIGYRGLNKNYSIFLMHNGAAVIEWEKEDVSSLITHFYIFDGKSLIDAENNPIFKNIKSLKETINNPSPDCTYVHFYSHSNVFEINYTKFLDKSLSIESAIECKLIFEFDGSKFVKTAEERK
ncbi:MAG: hypothetical protein IJJ71_06775 [Treponema sp.]|uniref:discoidin domain-containing protein n=1 Tax=Treponema sp. TaxID=166 RepID=UPI0025D587DF|nr:discoidin domain-containing protein [Treponema sp.]MBR0495857.1 hypothetical protein [Treponema sp.]